MESKPLYCSCCGATCKCDPCKCDDGKTQCQGIKNKRPCSKCDCAACTCDPATCKCEKDKCAPGCCNSCKSAQVEGGMNTQKWLIAGAVVAVGAAAAFAFWKKKD